MRSSGRLERGGAIREEVARPGREKQQGDLRDEGSEIWEKEE